MLRLRDLLFQHPHTVAIILQVPISGRIVHIAAEERCRMEWNPALASSLAELLGPGRAVAHYDESRPA
jgi:hypothetical protein